MGTTDQGGPHANNEGVATHASGAFGGSSATWFVHSFASQDWLFIGYLSALLVALAFGKGHDRSACMVRVSADLGLYLFVLALVRLHVLRWGSLVTALVYRCTIMVTLLASFFQLREILPAVSPWSVDGQIYAFDLRVFGGEPSVLLDRFVSPATTEWFAFFYFLYFLILTVHVIPMLLQRDEVVLGHFALAILLVFMTAHLVYMAVPGWGPYWYLKGTFEHDLEGGPFWKLVREAVDAGGAQKDIFPSLHTAVPTFLAIFGFRHRGRVPFRYTWPVVAFLATQIIVATMFLRWHYLVDVVAGLGLAITATLLAERIADWERLRRERLGVQPAWMPLVYPWSRSSVD
jgi:membrane-associated phospholipid phosphatase